MTETAEEAPQIVVPERKIVLVGTDKWPDAQTLVRALREAEIGVILDLRYRRRFPSVAEADFNMKFEHALGEYKLPIVYGPETVGGYLQPLIGSHQSLIQSELQADCPNAWTDFIREYERQVDRLSDDEDRRAKILAFMRMPYPVIAFLGKAGHVLDCHRYYLARRFAKQHREAPLEQRIHFEIVSLYHEGVAPRRHAPARELRRPFPAADLDIVR